MTPSSRYARLSLEGELPEDRRRPRLNLTLRRWLLGSGLLIARRDLRRREILASRFPARWRLLWNEMTDKLSQSSPNCVAFHIAKLVLIPLGCVLGMKVGSVHSQHDRFVA